MATTYSQASYPLGAPTISGAGNITVSMMLKQPTRISRYLQALPLRNFLSPLLFSNPAGVQGGGVIYDQLTLNDLFSTRDVQTVEPGGEFPILNSDTGVPNWAAVEKDGGKFFVLDEARDRNDQGVIQREGRKLLNTIIRKLDAKAVAAVNAALSAYPSQVVAGHSWSTVVTGGSSQTNNSGWPGADFAAAQAVADGQELGVEFNSLAVNPAQKASLVTVYGADYMAVLDAYGITNVVSSNRVTAGTAFLFEEQQVGEQRYEKALDTETWREQATQRTWVQSDVRAVRYVTNPLSIVKLTGIA
jgi:hypothetical protein